MSKILLHLDADTSIKALQTALVNRGHVMMLLVHQMIGWL
ncbi:hypothetical protein FIS3754_44690 [Fischerella sp. NIES-3754]|nr:hypothetical protein FIS3754_44690 [Fischerella sp. NIES-3754]